MLYGGNGTPFKELLYLHTGLYQLSHTKIDGYEVDVYVPELLYPHAGLQIFQKFPNGVNLCYTYIQANT